MVEGLSTRRVPSVAIALVAVSLAVPWPVPALFIALPLSTAALWQSRSGWGSAWSKNGVRPAAVALALAAGAMAQLVLVKLMGGGSLADWIGVELLPPLRTQPEALTTVVLNATVGNAIAAELVFRGFLQRQLELRRLGTAAVILPALLFGLASGAPLPVGLTAVLGGIGLGLHYRATGDVLMPIAFRMGFDLVYIAVVAV